MTISRVRSAFIAVVLATAIGGGLWWSSGVSPRQQFQLGLDAVTKGDWEQVRRSADRLKDHADFAAQEHLLRGIFLLKIRRPEAALVEFAKFEPIGELREPALMSAGEAMYSLDRLAEAQRLFGLVASEHPGHVESHRWLASIAYDLGAFNQAMGELDIVLRLAPNDYRPHLLKGHMLTDTDQFASAIKEYAAALKAGPPEPIAQETLSALAAAQIQNREYSDAIATLAKAERTAPNLALHAECEMSLGRPEAAAELVTEVQAINPDEPVMLKILGRLELDAGHPAAAVKPLRQATDFNPRDFESRHQLAQALRLLGDTAEADVEVKRAVKTMEQIGQLSLLNQSAIERPTDVELRLQIADLCNQLGMKKLAVMWTKAAESCRRFAPLDGPLSMPGLKN